MMKIRVCTGWHPAGRVLYGQTFINSFDRLWPESVELRVYTEEPEWCPRDSNRSLWDIPGARELDRLMQADEKFAGRVPTEKWKPKHRKEGYNFRFDARKFWKQLLIPGAAAEGLEDGDILIWLDGDVETIATVPRRFVPDMLDHADIAFLGRGEKHSEIGFWAVKISEATLWFLDQMAEIYKSGHFIKLREWHSAYVWDEARMCSRLKEANLTRPGTFGHVWPMSQLGRYMIHAKGKRKPGGVHG